MKKFFPLAILAVILSSCASNQPKAPVSSPSPVQEKFVGENGVFTIEAECPYTVEFKDLGDVLMIRYRFTGEELRKLHVKVDSNVFIHDSIGAQGLFSDGSFFAASFTDSFITLRHLSGKEKLLVFRETLDELIVAVGLSSESRQDADARRLEKKPLLIF